MTALARLLAATLALGLAVTVLGLWACTHAYRAAQLATARRQAERREQAAAEVRALADVDVLGSCVWCGSRHDRHPALVHADEVAARIRAA